MFRWFHFGIGLFAALSLSGCGTDFSQGESCSSCNETDLNAPVPGKGEKEPVTPADPNVYEFPEYAGGNPVPRTLWEQTKRYYNTQWRNFRIRRYVTMINLGVHSSKKRFWLLDLKNGAIQALHTSHGEGSDPNRNGTATKFSNVENSRMSSLGVFRVVDAYIGRNGRSVRLEGLDSTNSNALARAIVIHPAKYVSENEDRAGLSFGCPALDPNYAQGVIDKIKDGSILVIANIRQ